MKLCKNCVFSTSGNQFAKCRYNMENTPETIDLVNGNVIKAKLKEKYCSVERMDYGDMDYGDCKSLARYYVDMFDANSFEYGFKSYWTFWKKIKFSIHLIRKMI